MIAVLSLITVLIWFGSEIFRSLSKSPETKVPDEVLTPLDPTLDEAALNKLENSLFFDASQIPLLASPSPIESPTATTAPEASPEAEASSSPNVSPEPTTSP